MGVGAMERRGGSLHSCKRPSTMEAVEARRLLAAYVGGPSPVYATIQAAVDAAAPGSIITVDAGTYNEQLRIDKPLILRGAQAGVDARVNSRPGGETVLNGALTAT